MRNVGLPQYDATFERNLVRVRLGLELKENPIPNPIPNPNSNPNPNPSPNPSLALALALALALTPTKSGAKLQWLQMSQLAQLGVASFAHQKELMKAVRPIPPHLSIHVL